MFENGCFPSGVIESVSKMGAEQRKDAQAAYSALNRGTSKFGRIMVLDQDMHWKSMSMTPMDSQMIESWKQAAIEVCRIYQVPPPLIQDFSHSSFTNSEQAGRWFAQFCLLPWVKKLEAEFSRSLFAGTPYSLEFDMSSYDRGNSESRWQGHKIAIEAGVLTTNEVREVEGWSPRVEG